MHIAAAAAAAAAAANNNNDNNNSLGNLMKETESKIIAAQTCHKN